MSSSRLIGRSSPVLRLPLAGDPTRRTTGTRRFGFGATASPEEPLR